MEKKSGFVHKVQHFKKQMDEHSMLNSKPKSKSEKKRDFAKGVCPIHVEVRNT